MRASVFVGTSLDGFIARLDGAFDFLPEGGGEPHGYQEFMAAVDALVIGRKTYETVLGLGEWPYGDKLTVVLSTQPLAAAPAGAVIEQMSGMPAEIVSQLSRRGIRHAYVDGGITIQRFLAAGLIQRITITRVPVLIGTGFRCLPLYLAISILSTLRHSNTPGVWSRASMRWVPRMRIIPASRFASAAQVHEPRGRVGADCSDKC